MLSSQNAGTGVYFLVYGADDLTAGRLKDFCKSATAVPLFLLLLQKKTSPGGFRFPSGAPLNQPRKPLRFSWIFPAIFETAQIFWRYTYKLRRGRCRSQPFATKERYGCGSAACRYTSARWEVTNSPQISEKSDTSCGRTESSAPTGYGRIESSP